MSLAEMIYTDGQEIQKYPEVDISAFKSDGIVTLRQFFERNKLADLEQNIIDLYLMQAAKIGEYRDIAELVASNEPIGFMTEFGVMQMRTRTQGERLARICSAMEKDDKDALNQVQKFFSASQEIRSFFDNDFLDICRELLGEKLVLLDGPALLVNTPRSDQLFHKWHSEAHHYRGRRRFVNIWFPLFEEKNFLNGTMAVKVGSHKKYYDYPAHLEVPDNFHKEFPEHLCETERGDLIIFDRNLIHASKENQTKKHSFACVARVWTPKDDLNLSGDMCGVFGRANLIVSQ